MASAHIVITRTSKGARVVVDGVEIPRSAIPIEDGIHVPTDGADAPRVHLKLIAKRVDVVNTIEPTETEETP